MDDGDFNKSFMQNVKIETEKQQKTRLSTEKKHEQRLKIAMIVSLALIVVMAIVVAVLLIKRNNGDSTPPSADEAPAKGSAREYKEDEEEEKGDLVSIRMACKNGNTFYDFYKNNTYMIIASDTDDITEEGEYVFKGNKKIVLTSDDEGEETAMTFEDGKITNEDGVSFDCEEYDDA